MAGIAIETKHIGCAKIINAQTMHNEMVLDCLHKNEQGA